MTEFLKKLFFKDINTTMMMGLLIASFWFPALIIGAIVFFIIVQVNDHTEEMLKKTREENFQDIVAVIDAIHKAADMVVDNRKEMEEQKKEEA